MRKIIISITSLLLSIGILLFGHGLLTTLLSLRGVEEGFTEPTIGFFISMYFLGYISGTFICPKIIKRVGHIRALSALAAIFAGISILQGFWINIAVWSAVRFASGLSIVGIYMVIESWMNSQATNETRGRIFGFYQLISLLFLASGQFLILAGDVNELDLFAISAALICLSLVPVALTRLPEPAPVAEIKIELKDLYRLSPLSFMGCLISGLVGSVFWGLGPLFAKQSGFTEFGIAAFMSITILGGIVLQLPIGLWSDKHDRRIAIMMVGFVSALMAMIAAFSPPGESYQLSISMFIFGGMLFAIYPLSVAHANDHSESIDRVAVSTNLLLTYGIGAGIGPVFAGLMMSLTGHYFILIYFMTGGLILGAYAYHRRRHGVQISIEDQTNFVPQTRTSQVMPEGLYGEEEDVRGEE
ncbi:MAG: MFS transporter [Gammaproteobacteria bacterium]